MGGRRLLRLQARTLSESTVNKLDGKGRLYKQDLQKWFVAMEGAKELKVSSWVTEENSHKN